jgi:hypothetical protein
MKKSPNDNNYKSKIEKIICRIQCTKNIKCYESNFENICKAEDIGLPVHLICLEERPQNCSFLVSIGEKDYCGCPLRFYIANELKK